MENANLLDIPSHAEYIVCTKALNSNKINPVIGFSLFTSPAGFVLLLGSGQLLTFNLIADPDFLREIRANKREYSKKNETPINNGQAFVVFISNILMSEVSTPILKLDKSSEPSAKEMLELLMHATQTLREQYFPKHDKAKQEIEKRVKVLQLLKVQQLKDLEHLQREKDKIRANAERLAELYEDICDKQQILFRRAQDVIRLATINNPQTNVAELDFVKKIEKINEITKTLGNNLMLAKRKLEYQENQINLYNAKHKAKAIVLHPKAETVIKDTLGEMYVIF